MYSTSQLASHFAVNAQTVKRYAEEFRDYLSPTATPEGGNTRRFTEDDVKVYDLIVRMKQDGKRFEQIHAALASGERGELPDFEIGSLTAAQSSAQLRLLKRVAELQTEVERLRGVDARLEEVREQLAEAKAEIKSLNREIGRLEAKHDE
ncbi:MAG: MerR family transcriptional regulator [Anaerolineae bacterium]|jgi:DNA-binding transcriptional MerR regulator|nr:MerR family transcriptional regulator [Anaerolineae bacterium]